MTSTFIACWISSARSRSRSVARCWRCGTAGPVRRAGAVVRCGHDTIEDCGESHETLIRVASAAQALKHTNDRLIQEFALTKRENDTLRNAVREKTRMEGGSDFIVGEASAWRIDPETSIGLESVYARRAITNLTSRCRRDIGPQVVEQR